MTNFSKNIIFLSLNIQVFILNLWSNRLNNKLEQIHNDIKYKNNSNK